MRTSGPRAVDLLSAVSGLPSVVHEARYLGVLASKSGSLRRTRIHLVARIEGYVINSASLAVIFSKSVYFSTILKEVIKMVIYKYKFSKLSNICSTNRY